jgi:hypothetical protein
MFTARNIRELLEVRPFKPFQICLSDGTRHEVPHPEFAWVIGSRVFVGAPVNGSPEADFSVRQLSILRISRIKDLPDLKAA